MARPGFIIDDMDNDMIDDIADESDGEDELFDSVCAICDNGGDLVWYGFFFLLWVDLIHCLYYILFGHIYVIVHNSSRV